MQTQKPTLELLTCKGAYRDNPTALFHQLCGDRPATLLLESADIDSKDDLKSLLLVDSALRITALSDTVTIQALTLWRDLKIYRNCQRKIAALISVFISLKR